MATRHAVRLWKPHGGMDPHDRLGVEGVVSIDWAWECSSLARAVER